MQKTVFLDRIITCSIPIAPLQMGTIFERSRKSEPFHVQNDDDPVVVPVGAKRPIVAGLGRGINAGSSFYGPQVFYMEDEMLPKVV